MSDPIKRPDHRLAAFALFAALCGAFALTPNEAHSQDEISIAVDVVGLIEDGDANTVTFNAATCKSVIGKDIEIQIGFAVANFPSTQNLSYGVKLDTESGCLPDEISDSAQTGCTSLNNTPADVPKDNNIGGFYREDFTIPFSTLFPDITTEEACEITNDVEIMVVGEGFQATDIPDTTNKITFSRSLALLIDGERPNEVPPTPSVVPGETTIQINFTADSAAASYKAYLSTSPIAAGDNPTALPSGSFLTALGGSGETVDISSRNLAIGETAYLALTIVDSSENESLLGDSVAFEVTETFGYPERYAESGGQETGGFIFSGCNVSRQTHRPSGLLGGLALGLLALLLTVGLRRRRGAALVLAAFAISTFILVGSPDEAQAQDRVDTVGVFELKLGGYLPKIDDEFGGSATPYKDIFGSSSLFITEIEIDRQLYRGFGTFALGFSGGFMEATGLAIQKDANGNASPSVDEASMNILVTRLSAVYRFDVLAVEYDLPFVPVAKLGLDYFIWWTRNSEGEIEQSQNFIGRGDTLGWHFSLGMHLLLDWFDEVSADTLMADYGLANTYLFGEWVFSQVDDFGSDTSHDLSDPSGFFFGIAFEY